jgi:hypothetical protein
MPLTSLQTEIAHLIAPNRSPESHLAGGAALHLKPDSLRISNDLDYFHDTEVLVGQAFAADRAILESSGYTVEIAVSLSGFIRAIVNRNGNATKVEWAHDSAWRFMPPVKDAIVGYRLHPLDLAINKVLALVGRDEPRDFLDVIFVHRNFLSVGSLCWAAVGKDPGFSPTMLVEMLARKGRYRAEDFAALNLIVQPDVVDLKRTWIEAIDGARRLVRDLPPEDVGCLYWNPASKRFENPDPAGKPLVRHFGCRGGILPSIGEEDVFSGDEVAKQLLSERIPVSGRPKAAIRSGTETPAPGES